MRTLFVAWSAFFLLLFSGCMGTPSTPQIPKWVEHPPEATGTLLYGVSVADGKAKAVVAATSMLADAVFTAAHEPLKVLSLNRNEKRHVEKEMKRILATLDYRSVTVEEEHPMDKNVAVLVQMQRAEMLRQLRQRLQEHLERLQKHLDVPKSTPQFGRLGAYGKAYEERFSLIAYAVLIQTLDPLAKLPEVSRFITQVTRRYDALKYSASVGTIADAGAIAFVEPLKKAFESEGIRTQSLITKDGGTVLLFSNRQREMRGGEYYLSIRLRLQSKAAEKTVAEAEHFFRAVSPRGYDDAQRIIARTFTEQIREAGLFHYLNF